MRKPKGPLRGVDPPRAAVFTVVFVGVVLFVVGPSPLYCGSLPNLKIPHHLQRRIEFFASSASMEDDHFLKKRERERELKMLKVVFACFSIIGLVVWYLHFYQGLLFCFCHKEGKRKKAVFYLCIYLLIYLVFIKWESMFSYAGTREDPL